jgi:hypothetical protein
MFTLGRGQATVSDLTANRQVARFGPNILIGDQCPRPSGAESPPSKGARARGEQRTVRAPAGPIHSISPL